MNKYDSLLSKISQQFRILKGDHETELEWKIRILYSICGMMAYTSLWERPEGYVSIQHLKRKIHTILVNYIFLYPELSIAFSSENESLEDEIYNQFLNSGLIYHRAYEIFPSIKQEKSFGSVIFQRGIDIDSISYLSGNGFYSISSETNISKNINDIKEMFGLEQNNLQEIWDMTLSKTVWQESYEFKHNTEYLRLKPPFNYGYWVNKADKSGRVSILRTGNKGAQLYYLYRYKDNIFEISKLSTWQTENYSYRTIACACLLAHGTLPPIMYTEDGVLIHLHLNYLLPPRELAFLKIYSWPEKCNFFPCDFQRKLTKEVFSPIKDILSDAGYKFVGEMN